MSETVGPTETVEARASAEAPAKRAYVPLIPEKTKEISRILRREALFGIGEALSNDTLSPQALAEVWSQPAVLDLLNQFNALPNQNAKITFAQSATAQPLVQAVGTTKQILAEQQAQTEAQNHQAAAQEYLAEFEVDVQAVPAELEPKVLATLANISAAGYNLQQLTPAEAAEINAIISNQIKGFSTTDGKAQNQATEYLVTYAQNNNVDIDHLPAAVKAEVLADLAFQISTINEGQGNFDSNELDKKIRENLEKHSVSFETGKQRSKEKTLEKETMVNEQLKKIGAKPISVVIEAFQKLELGDEVMKIGLANLRAMQAELEAVKTLGQTKEEQVVLENLVNTTPVKPWETVPAARYALLISQIDSTPGLSDETRNAAKQQLGVAITYKPEVKTGGDANAALGAGYGINDQGERVPYSEDNPLKARSNLEMYEENGDKVMKIRFGGEIITTRLKGAFDYTIGDVANTMAVLQVAESMGLNKSFFGKDFETGAGEIAIYGSDINKAKQITSSFLGAFVGFDGDIASEQDIGRLRNNFQWLRSAPGIQGNGGANDRDPEKARADLTALGIVDKDGSVVEPQLKKAGLYIQQNSFTGTLRFENLRQFLNQQTAQNQNTLYPDRAAALQAAAQDGLPKRVDASLGNYFVISGSDENFPINLVNHATPEEAVQAAYQAALAEMNRLKSDAAE